MSARNLVNKSEFVSFKCWIEFISRIRKHLKWRYILGSLLYLLKPAAQQWQIFNNCYVQIRLMIQLVLKLPTLQRYSILRQSIYQWGCLPDILSDKVNLRQFKLWMKFIVRITTHLKWWYILGSQLYNNKFVTSVLKSDF